ncbi:TPA: hypothetical protein MYL85_003903 [Klebsiella pneumoniae]|nr:hypothetical protein [Klebsiella pneumoniae]
MHSAFYTSLVKISSSYFIKADTLFRTIIFQNIAISHANQKVNPELHAAYIQLESFLEENSPEISDKGIRHDLVSKHMPSLWFSSLVSAFEDYIIEISKLIFKLRPENLDKVKCDYGVFKSLSEDELFDHLVNEGVASLTFGSPKEYINKLCKLIQIEKKTIEPYLKQYIEIKARRDTGVHNNWIKDSRYERKLAEVGLQPDAKNYLTPDLNYFRHSFDLCGKLVKLISNNISTELLKEQEIFKQEKSET